MWLGDYDNGSQGNISVPNFRTWMGVCYFFYLYSIKALITHMGHVGWCWQCMLAHIWYTYVTCRDTRAWLYQRVQKLLLKCVSNEPNIQIKLMLYCMNEIRVIGTCLGSGSLDPNIWVLLPFLDINIGTLLW